MSVRALGKQVLHVGGLYRAQLRRRPFPGLAVLAYHGILAEGTESRALPFGTLHVTRRLFEDHCRTLCALCSPISLAQWREARSGRTSLPPRPVLVTFDDGYRSVLTDALPVLERYQVPAVVFACAEPIERGERFWFDVLGDRAGDPAVEYAKALPYAKWRTAAESCREPACDDDALAPLSPDELRQLSAHPLIEIGNHTARHPILARGTAAEQRREIEEGRERLQALTGKPILAFAYPNGRPGVDYSDVTADLVRGSGAQDAFAVRSGFASVGASLSHPRFLMLDGVDGAELAHRLTWSWRAAPVPA
jgi:peptidoglycan/xylan/chitin deacetylase (PgdA/CDA1 family)